jgi:nucleoside-diphosphate-sugar epimerase
MIMKALIVGGTGCISSEISALAAKKPGMELYLLHRGNRPQFVPPGAHSIQADIKKPDEVREKLKGMQFDVLAQFISYGVDDINRDLELFKGHFNQYMFISSTAVYRSRSPMEIITEDKAIVGNSVWAYGLHKLQAEMRLREERGKNGLNYTVVRPSFTYNNLRIFHPVVRDDHQHYSWTLADRILKGKPLLMFDDGNALCTLTYAADFAKAFVGLMGNPNACGEAYHIACDEYFTYNRVAEMIGEALGTPTRLCHVPAHLLGFEFGTHYGEKLISFGHGGLICSAKVRKAVPEFVCTTYFAEGIRKCIRFYDENPSFKVVNPEWDAEMDRIVVKYGNGVRIG